jgi:hypothetical protein
MHPSALDHPRGQIRVLPSQKAKLADESARSKPDQRRLGSISCGRAHDLDRAAFNDDQVVGRIAGRERGSPDVQVVGPPVSA